MSQFCRLIDFVICGIQFAVSNVLHDCSGKQMCILEYNSQRMPQIRFLNLINVNTIIADLSILHVVETIDQVCDRRLTCTCRSHERQLLSRFRIQRQIMQHHVIRLISKAHVKETDITFQLCIGNRAVCLMGMFPCPHTGSLFYFFDRAIFSLARVDQCHITFIYFRLLVHHLEDTLRTCESHDNGVKLLRDLHEWLREALGKLQIRCHHSERDIADSGY